MVGCGFIDVAFPWFESFQRSLPAGAVEGGETVLRLDHVAIFGSGLDALEGSADGEVLVEGVGDPGVAVRIERDGVVGRVDGSAVQYDAATAADLDFVHLFDIEGAQLAFPAGAAVSRSLAVLSLDDDGAVWQGLHESSLEISQSDVEVGAPPVPSACANRRAAGPDRHRHPTE